MCIVYKLWLLWCVMMIWCAWYASALLFACAPRVYSTVLELTIASLFLPFCLCCEGKIVKFIFLSR